MRRQPAGQRRGLLGGVGGEGLAVFGRDGGAGKIHQCQV